MQERRAVLDEEPLCRACLAQNVTRASVEVDHIVPLHLGGSDRRSNKQGLCAPCHRAKTAAEARDRGGARRMGPDLS